MPILPLTKLMQRNFRLMEETNHIHDGVLPFTKTTGVGANCKTFNTERHGKMVFMYAWRSKLIEHCKTKARLIRCPISIEPIHWLASVTSGLSSNKCRRYLLAIVVVRMVQYPASNGERLNLTLPHLMRGRCNFHYPIYHQHIEPPCNKLLMPLT